MLPFAYFGIESSGLNLVIDLFIVFVVVLYLALIYWTYNDARRRIEDPMLVGCATAASLFPFVGTIVYVVLRPPEYLEDARERELEIQAAEARLHELDHSLCPHCDYRIERDFVRCPSCLRKLKERCAGCQRPLDQTWAICPYCETEVAGAAPVRRRRRRRADSEEASGPSLEASRSSLEESRISREERRPSLEEAAPLFAESISDGAPGTSTSADMATSTELATSAELSAAAPSAPDLEARARPVAAPEPSPASSRTSGRARRPRSSS
ncbi:MAG TPA: zinc ribbon domain-containing protein [Solirubrobacteraceae bacterium]|nr:zinc ribbon domain-containing protein [Solirubrobacteraceae bacterium]